MRIRTTVAAVVSVLCVAILTGSATAANVPTLLTADGGSFAVRPVTVDYTGDGTGIIGKLPPKQRGRWHWLSWKAHRAFGVGTIWIDNCVPDCAQGTFHSHKGSVLATRVRHGHFTRIKLRFKYHGHKVTDIRGLARNGGYYSWYIVSTSGF